MLVQIPIVASALLRGEADMVLEILLPLTIFIGLAFYLVFVLVIHPQRTARKIEKDGRLNSPVQYEADNEQIMFHNGFTESRVYWRSFYRFVETKEHFLLIYSANRNMFQVIPKRAFASAEEVQAFRRLLVVEIA